MCKNRPSPCMRTASRALTIHLALRSTMSASRECEDSKIKIAIRRVGIKHGEQSEREGVKSGRVHRQMTEHEATEQVTGVDSFGGGLSANSSFFTDAAV